MRHVQFVLACVCLHLFWAFSRVPPILVGMATLVVVLACHAFLPESVAFLLTGVVGTLSCFVLFFQFCFHIEKVN